MRKSTRAIIAGAAGALTTAAISWLYFQRLRPGRNKHGMKTAEHVDIKKYQGDWYTIARYPASFQDGYFSSMAHYMPQENGNIKVVNTCRLDSPLGELKTISGKAWIVDTESNAKLKVQFYWPLASDYWILAVAPDYSWSVVGEPSGEYLWILSREPEKPKQIDQILEIIEANGYSRKELIWEKHQGR